jgi:hypothetical protein
VQTLPRLNRAHAQNHDVFLDFMNDTDTIQAVFATAPVRPGLSEERGGARDPPRNHRHGQLPGREVGRDAESPSLAKREFGDIDW